jgi:LPXTG-motif cell wall-anchored protein
MKKLLVIVLALSLIVFGSSMTAFAEELSIAADNLGRGAGDSTVVENADGSITTATSNISFYLPAPVKAGEEVTVHITGSSDGDFRVWLIDEQEVTNTTIYKMSEHGFTSGDFDETFTLTANADVTDSTEIFFKAPAWDAPLNNLTLTLVDIEYAEGVEVDLGEDEEEVEEVVEDEVVEDAEEEVAEVTAAPKTGVISTALFLGLGAAVLGTGAVVLKKKED